MASTDSHGHGGCDDYSDRWSLVMVVMIIVTDGRCWWL